MILSTKWIPTLAMIGSAGCWGSATILSKICLDSFGPLSLLLIQLGASVAFLWGIVILKGLHHSLTRSLVYRAAIGILEPGLAYLLVLMGLAQTMASSAAIIASTEPLMVLVLSAFIFREKIRAKIWSIAILAMIGVAMTSFPEQNDGMLGSVHGDLLIIFGTMCAALYVVLSPYSLQGHNPVLVAAIQQAWGLVALMIVIGPAALTRLLSDDSVNVTVWGVAVLSGVVQYGLAFWGYLFALRTLTVSNASMLLNLTPVFGLATSYSMLNERLSCLQWIGVAIVLGAVSLNSGFKSLTFKS